MSDGSRVRVSIIEENTFGEIPVGLITLKQLPIVSTAMRDRIGYVQSNIINPSRDIEDLVRLSKSAGGTLPCEFRYSPAGDALMLALEAVLCSGTFTAATTQVTGVTSTSGVLSLGSANVETGVEIGDTLRILDNADALLGFAQVASINVGAHTVTLRTGHGIADGVNRKVRREARGKNGTATPSFTIEIAYLDLQMAHIFVGCVFAKADFSIAIGQLSTITFTIEAKGSQRVSTNTGTPDQFITGATYTAAATHPTLSPIDVQEIRVGGLDYAASSIATSWDNIVRGRERLGNLGLLSIARGPFSATQRASAYHDNFDDHDDYAENVPTDQWFVLVDTNNRGYAVSYPKAKFSDVDSGTQGNNSDVFKNVSMTAYKDPVELTTVRMQRIGD